MLTKLWQILGTSTPVERQAIVPINLIPRTCEILTSYGAHPVLGNDWSLSRSDDFDKNESTIRYITDVDVDVNKLNQELKELKGIDPQ
jgi:hypothetical protein